MQNRIVEISSDGAHISVSRGFLLVAINGDKAGQVAIEDMAALIIRGHGASLSVNICSRLSKANVPIIICGDNQSPASVIWPVSGHFSQGLHMQAQAVANKPLLKRLWSQLIKAKIEAQANVLGAVGVNNTDIRAMARRVKSGDSDNLEAQVARRYWTRLMGNDFRRDRQEPGINAALNYGYTVLRAATARSILAAGLHPSLSLQHKSRGDVVLFDLPTTAPKERQAYCQFRNFLLDNGFEMAQYSVYVKHTSGKDAIKAIIRKVEAAMPAEGKVDILQFTDKQYENIVCLRGGRRTDSLENPQQLVLF